jgi:hypothetical protein
VEGGTDGAAERQAEKAETAKDARRAEQHERVSVLPQRASILLDTVNAVHAPLELTQERGSGGDRRAKRSP